MKEKYVFRGGFYTYKFKPGKPITSCEVYDNKGKFVAWGISRCRPEDKWDLWIGMIKSLDAVSRKSPRCVFHEVILWLRQFKKPEEKPAHKIRDEYVKKEIKRFIGSLLGVMGYYDLLSYEYPKNATENWVI